MPTVGLRVACGFNPPAMHDGEPTEFGLQNKKRALMSGAQDLDGSIAFEIEAMAESRSGTNLTSFSGPFVHGSPAARFLYLGWRRANGPDDAWIRRWKIPLADVPFEHVETHGTALEIRLNDDEARGVWLRGSGWKLYSAERLTA